MSFNSVEYVAFLAVVVGVTWALRHRAQNVFLLAASYAFYALWDWRFLALLFVSTVIGYTSGLALEQATEERKRKTILATRVAMNLGMLGVFKYAGFFVDSAVDLAQSAGFGVSAPTLQIILPVAISYYTFEEISYAVDIYRRQIRPCRDPIAYGLFVAFFPKLVAGPILRPKELIPQITEPRRRPDATAVLSGLGLLARGLVKKVVIADSLARYVDEIYADPLQMSGLTLAVGTLCFAGQIYGDFSGYSDMARGASRLLGFELPVNFRQPYLSNSLTAFWRTWHISLSSWLRDYLYIPLGGNKRSSRRTMVNLMTVMVLGGLWHGAGWTFLIWGAIHGSMLALERALRSAPDNSDALPRLGELPRIATTFAVVCLAWVFFRAPDLGDALAVVTRIVTFRPGEMVTGALVWLVVASVVLVASDLLERHHDVASRTADTGEHGGGSNGVIATAAAGLRTNPAAIGVLLGLGLAGLLVTSGGDPVPFIYFQF